MHDRKTDQDGREPVGNGQAAAGFSEDLRPGAAAVEEAGAGAGFAAAFFGAAFFAAGFAAGFFAAGFAAAFFGAAFFAAGFAAAFFGAAFFTAGFAAAFFGAAFFATGFAAAFFGAAFFTAGFAATFFGAAFFTAGFAAAFFGAAFLTAGFAAAFFGAAFLTAGFAAVAFFTAAGFLASAIVNLHRMFKERRINNPPTTARIIQQRRRTGIDEFKRFHTPSPDLGITAETRNRENMAGRKNGVKQCAYGRGVAMHGGSGGRCGVQSGCGFGLISFCAPCVFLHAPP